MRNGHVIYQEIADPILPAAASETITLDKWHQTQPNPVLRRSLQVAILAGSFFFFNTEALATGRKVPEWHPQQNQPGRLVNRLPRIQNNGEYRFEVPRTILVSDWFQPTGQPYFRRIARNIGAVIRTDIVAPQETITIDKWFQPSSQPFFRRLARIPGGQFRTDFSLPAPSISGWGQAIVQPLFRHRQTARLEIVIPVGEFVTIDKWFVPISQPRIRRQIRQAPNQPVFEDIQVSSWYVPSLQPLKLKVTRNFSGEFRVDVIQQQEVINLDKWYQPPSEPVRRKVFLIQGGETRIDIITLIGDVISIYSPIGTQILLSSPTQGGLVKNSEIAEGTQESSLTFEIIRKSNIDTES